MSMSVKWSAERLVGDVQGHVIELKKEFFSSKRPIDDDESHLHKFCVKLENILRFKQKEKYSFMGGRKDYWNFFQECLPKEESIKFIQVMPNFKTNQGKGRAFIRQALMEKTLADTLQRCIIETKVVRDWYGVESILMDDRLNKSLIHCLYDLNSVDFDLPIKGYDLDRAWPSFARRSFQGRGMTRSGSSTSLVAPSDLQNKRNDPLYILASKVRKLHESVSHPGDSSTKDHDDYQLTDNDISMHVVIQNISEIQYLYDQWNINTTNKHMELENELKRLQTSKEKNIDQSHESLRELHEKYLSLGKLDSDSLKDQVTKLFDMYKGKEEETTRTLIELNNLQGSLSQMTQSQASINEQNQKLRSDIAKLEKESFNHVATIEKLRQDLNDKEAIIESMQSKNVTIESNKDNNVFDMKNISDLFENKFGKSITNYDELKEELNKLISNANNSIVLKDTDNTTNDSEIIFKQHKKEINNWKSKFESSEELINNLETQLKSVEKDSFVTDLKEKLELFEYIDNVETLADAEDGLKRKNDKTVILERLTSVHNQLVSAMKECDELKFKISVLSSTAKDNESEKQGVEEFCEETKHKNEELQEKLQSSINQSIKVAADLQSSKKSVFDLSMEVSSAKEKVTEQEKTLAELNQHKFIIDAENAELKTKNKEFLETNRKLDIELQSLNEQLKILKQAKLECEEFYADQMIDMNQLQADMKEKYANLEEECIDTTGKISELQEHVDCLKTAKAKASTNHEHEIQSLRFQYGNEEMKHQAAIKRLTEKLTDFDAMEIYSNELELELSDWKEKHAQLLKTTETEKEEKVQMKIQHDLVIVRLAEVENEVGSMEKQLIATTKQRDDEKNQRVCISQKLEKTVTDATKHDKQTTAIIERLENDIDVLKQNLVFITKDKSDLWMKSNVLETELKSQSGDRWLDDTEANECTDCKSEFSLLLRKHHCRICGKIFCHSCSKNYVSTPHSKTKVRACAACHHHLNKKNNSSFSTSSDVETDDARSDTSGLSRNLNTHDDLTPLSGNTGPVHPLKGDAEDSFNDFTDQDDDAYEILTKEEASNIEHYKEYQAFTVGITDIIYDALTPVLAHDELINEHREIVLAPRSRTLVPIIIGSSGVSLVYDVAAQPKSIAFGIALKTTEEYQNAELKTIIPVSRNSTTNLEIVGKLTIDNPGTYIMVLDNLFSRLSSKKVHLSVGLFYNS